MNLEECHPLVCGKPLLKMAYRVVIQLVEDLDSRSSRLSSQKRYFIAEDLAVPGLYEQRWKAFKIAKEWTCVWVGKIFFRSFAKVKGDWVHVVVSLGQHDNIIWRIGLPRFTAHGEIYV